MSDSVNARLDAVERKPLKCGLKGTTDSFVRVGKLVEVAVQRAFDSREEAADFYGVTASQMQRQLTNQDNQHLSFQRLWSMPVSFRLELVDLLLADLKAEGAPVEGETTWRIKRSA